MGPNFKDCAASMLVSGKEKTDWEKVSEKVSENNARLFIRES